MGEKIHEKHGIFGADGRFSWTSCDCISLCTGAAERICKPDHTPPVTDSGIVPAVSPPTASSGDTIFNKTCVFHFQRGGQIVWVSLPDGPGKNVRLRVASEREVTGDLPTTPIASAQDRGEVFTLWRDGLATIQRNAITQTIDTNSYDPVARTVSMVVLGSPVPGHC